MESTKEEKMCLLNTATGQYYVRVGNIVANNLRAKLSLVA
jgi:hypothetical protein